MHIIGAGGGYIEKNADNMQRKERVIMIKGYVISVICISVIGSLVSMLTPSGECGGINKNMRLIYGLCVVIVCINPIKDIVKEINELDISGISEIPEPDSERYDELFDSSYGAAETENLKRGIKQMLYDRFQIDFSECSVSVKITDKEDGKRELSGIYITLSGSSIFKDTYEIEGYFEELFGCETVIAIGGINGTE